MDLRHLQNFLVVLDQKSISNAASVIRIAQPALSRQLQALEQAVGRPLLVRHRWGVSATPAGEVLARHARDISHHLQLARDEMSAVDDKPSGTLAVGITASVARLLLPPLAVAAQAAMPGVSFRFVEGSSAGLQQQLLGRGLDMAVLYLRGRLPEIDHEPLLSEPVVAAGPAGLFENGGRVALSEVLKHQLLVTASSGRLRLLYEETVARAKAPQPASLEVDSFPALVEMLALGAGISMLPYSTIQAAVAEGRLSWAYITPTPLARRLSLARPGDRLRTPAWRETAGLLRGIVRDRAALYQWRPSPAP
jgi:LysR family nitrogen assimilation transcriptional regulator